MDDDEKEYIHQLGTHSCKTTILSWAAKKGTDLQIRKVMGYHSLGKSNSVFIYGRDNVSPALREIEEIINMIKSGRFEPDNTRSGYFKPSGDKNENEAVDPSLEDLRGASSSEDSADEDQIDHQEEELVERKVIGKWTGDLDETALPHCHRTRHDIFGTACLVSSICSLTNQAPALLVDAKRPELITGWNQSRRFCIQLASSVFRSSASPCNSLGREKKLPIELKTLLPLVLLFNFPKESVSESLTHP